MLQVHPSPEKPMNRSELIDRVAEKAETTKAAAARVVEAIFDTASGVIAEAVKAGSHVSIPGFGKFKPKTRAARKGRNPQTGAQIEIPEKTVVSFTAGKGLQQALGGKAGAKRGAAAKRKTGQAAGGTKAAAKTGRKAAGNAAGKATGKTGPAGGAKKSAKAT
jgi:DNA-binding protein HU-beta